MRMNTIINMVRIFAYIGFDHSKALRPTNFRGRSFSIIIKRVFL